MERISFKDLPAGYYPAMLQVQNYIDNCGLDVILLELMCIRVSQINGCAYCLDMHFKDAMEAGETMQRLISVSAWREAPYYSAKEQAVLAFAERLTKMPDGESNHDIHDELSAHFTQEEIANLTLAVAQINSWNRIVKSFGPVPGTYQPAKAHTVA